jgi:NDP-sugar pyrophosphorylase family protein
MLESAAILAGGLATRLRPLTEKIPKSLVTVAGQPFVDWQLRLLSQKGIRHVVLCLGYLGEQVHDFVKDGADWGLTVEYSFDGDKLLGTAGALLRALPLLPATFWLFYGDSYLDFDYKAVADYFEQNQSGKLGLMTVLHNQNQWDTSNVIFADGQLLKYDKFNRTPAMHYIDYGAAILAKAAFERVPPGEPYDLSLLYTAMVTEGKMLGYEVSQRFYEVGSHSGLAEMEQFLRQQGNL